MSKRSARGKSMRLLNFHFNCVSSLQCVCSATFIQKSCERFLFLF